MRQLIFILLISPLSLLAQMSDTSMIIYNSQDLYNYDQDSITMPPDLDSIQLPAATDSFLVFRCRARCAVKRHSDSVLYYGRSENLYQRIAYEHYLKWDQNAFDPKKKKTNLRFMNPDKF